MSTDGTVDDGTATRMSAEPSHDAHEDGSGHDSGIRIGFNERPFYDEMLMKKHPTKRYFDTYHLHPAPNGYVPVLVSSVLIDTAIRH
ncbi:MAG: hypothetical protein SGJ27_10475 [Candidatus Melainabacteria bacterium]|nr:hypothetical protein [Candidatus Melainabacteria bacterium]